MAIEEQTPRLSAPFDILSDQKRIYPLFIAAAILFNIGYLTRYGAGAITMFTVWDHIAFFVSNFSAILLGIFFALCLVWLTFWLSRTAAMKKIEAIRAKNELAYWAAVIMVSGAISMPFNSYQNSSYVAGLLLCFFAALFLGREETRRAAGQKGGNTPFAWLVIALAVSLLIYQWGRIAAESPVFRGSDIRIMSNGPERTGRLVATLQSGILVLANGQLEWIKADKYHQIIFVPRRVAALPQSGGKPPTGP